MEEILQDFGLSFAKPFLLKTAYSKPYKIGAFCIFHISLFLNTTTIVVNCYIVLYMCAEVIICQSGMSPERLMISQFPSIGGTSNQLRWEKECTGNSPSFWAEFYKTLPPQNSIFLPLQNWGMSGLPHFSICQYYSYGSE